MKVEVLKPLNHKGKTVEIGKIIELDDDTAKKLIVVKAVKTVEEVKAQKNENKNLTIGEQK
ncbi:DUF7210 family protein [Aliarcobacter vitoriensis]|uniref:DUF7210 domain-containing protein n=1 Tax=Aliarcobacter vitoriensis TaxID=2011099 RepID=A0A366MS33_9BACT|nr:hypothetical protein [Aliarcobacter vitoriensis]RBQ28414.1 hypothetical protein CRU91_09340 [Aliarcobacter vitoriensis]